MTTLLAFGELMNAYEFTWLSYGFLKDDVDTSAEERLEEFGGHPAGLARYQ